MPRAFESRVLQIATPAVSSTVTYSVPAEHDFGQVHGGILILGMNTTAQAGSWSFQLSYSWGVFSDAETVRSAQTTGVNGVTTTDVQQGSGDEFLGVLNNQQGTTQSITARLMSVGVGQVQIQWTLTAFDTPTNATLVLFGGTDTQCAVWNATPGAAGVATTVTTGFQTDTIFTGSYSGGGTGHVMGAHGHMSTGYVVRSPAGQGAAFFASRDNVGTSQSASSSLDGLVDLGVNYTANPFTFGRLTSATNFTATGFDIHAPFDLSQGIIQPVCGLAIRHGSVTSRYNYRQIPTVNPTTEVQTWFPEKPGFASYAIGSTTGAPNTMATVGIQTLAWYNFTDATMNNWGFLYRHNVATSQSGVFFDAGPNSFEHYFDDRTTLLATGTITGRTDTSFTVDFTNTLGLGYRYSALVIGEAEFTSTGAAQFPALTASGGAQLVFEASGSVDLPALVGAGTAQSFSGTGTSTLPSLSSSGSALQTFEGSGNAVFPSLQGSGLGVTLYATGAVSFPPLDAAGAGLVIFEGTGAATFSGLQASGTGGKIFSASGAASFVPPEVDGLADEIFSTTGAASFPALQAAGTGVVVEPITAIGAATFPALQAAGTGLLPDAVLIRDCALLLGSYDIRADLSGSHDSRHGIPGAHRLRVELNASHDSRANLLGSFDVRADLAGSLTEC